MLGKSKGKIVLALLLVFVMVLTGCSKDTAQKAEPAKAAFKPEKPITVIVPGGPGGATDLLARAVEKVWSKYCPQPMQIVNKGGGGGVEGAVAVKTAKPDGYTIIIGMGGGHDIVAPHLQTIEYKYTDLTPVARLSINSVVILAQGDSPFNSVKDVVDWAKRETKPVTIAVSQKAAAQDLTAQAFGKKAGINVTPIPHSGGAQAIITLLGGQTMLGTGHPAEIITHLKSGRLKPLGIALPERDPALPNIPTLKEQGVDIYTWGSVKGVGLPKNAPKEIVDYYADVFKKVAEDSEFKKVCQDMLQPAQYQNPEEFAKFLKQVTDDYGTLIKSLGIEKQ
ncbi:MAG: tripartite tricarboxylate transporter substrate binding protein [Sporomusaceae bacterium]|nr:tripartite tricarboxylate transporter substrate binding protein [Sporomusaceae bacterium]